MKRLQVFLAVVLPACFAQFGNEANAQRFMRFDPGPRQADVHNPYSKHYLPLRPSQPIRRGPAIRTRAPSFLWYGYYDPYYGPLIGFGNGPIYLPPYWASAESLYGTQPITRLMGVNSSSGGSPDVALENDPPPKRKKARETNAQTKAQAGKFLSFGDARFAKQKYSQALERYRTAAQLAPDVAEIFLRQGFALIALGKYELAPGALRRALRIRGDWSGEEFRLSDLYGGDEIAKNSHRELLAKSVELNPLDADLLFLLGMHLYFDGKQDRARNFFERSAQLGGNEEGELDGFSIARAAAAKHGGRGRVEF